MFYQLSEKITDKLQQLEVVSSEDREIYRYGVQQGCILMLNLLSIITLGLLCGMVKESIIYMLAFVPLRNYAGGYHARTHVRCYLYSMLMITVILLAMKLLILDFWVYALMMAVGTVTIFCLAPVEDENKPLDALEQKVYRKKAVLVISLEVLIFLVSGLFQISAVYCAFSMAVISLGILVLIGYIKNRMLRNFKCE